MLGQPLGALEEGGQAMQGLEGQVLEALVDLLGLLVELVIGIAKLRGTR